MQLWTLLLLASLAAAVRSSPTLPTGCFPLHLAGAEAEDWSPSFPLGRTLPIAIKSPTKTWQEFSFVFQRVDSTTVATLKVKKHKESVALILKRSAYSTISDHEGKNQQVIDLPQEVSQQLSLQNWTFISMSVDTERLQVTLEDMSAVRFDQVIATRFHQVYAHVSKGHYIDVSFYCDEGGRAGEPSSSPPPEELHAQAALTVVVVIIVILVLLTPTAVACCCLRRRRKKSAREESVPVERKMTRDADNIAYVEIPEIKPLMTGYQSGVRGTVAEEIHDSQGVMQGTVAGDMHGSQGPMQGTVAGEMHASQGVTEGIVAGEMHDSQNDMQETLTRDISEESRESVTTENNPLSADVKETNSQCSGAPTPTPGEEQAVDTEKDENNKPEEINNTDQITTEVKSCESGHEKSQETIDAYSNEADVVGESGPEVEVLDADEHKKDQGEKFLQGLLRTRERAAASLVGSRGREAGSPTDASNDSLNDDSTEGNKEPVETHSGIDEEVSNVQERRLADLINEMLYYSRTSGTSDNDEQKRTGDSRQETNNNQENSFRETVTTDEMFKGVIGDASKQPEEAMKSESSDPPAQLGVDPAVDAPREIDSQDETSNVSEGLEEGDRACETVLQESVETKMDSTLDDTKRQSEIENYNDSSVSKVEEENKTDMSRIVFPVGNSDYGVEKFKEAGIEPVYLETPGEETSMKPKPKKIYRSTPLTSLKLP